MMKWFPTVTMKRKTNLKTKYLWLNQNRIESTEKQRKTRNLSEKATVLGPGSQIVHGMSKQMIEASKNNLSL